MDYFKGFDLSSYVAALAIAIGATACSAGAPDLEGNESVQEDLTTSQAIARAQQWVDASLDYCQAAYGQVDSDDSCWSKPWESDHRCYRRGESSQWDSYRSDCSGLVAWAWGLSTGLSTRSFAPKSDAVSHVINAADLAPGDAINIPGDHIMLFTGWVTNGKRATFIEEPGCNLNKVTVTHARKITTDVSISGSNITPSGRSTFKAIRIDRTGGGGGSSGSSGDDCVVGGYYCGGDKVSGDPDTLYQCTGGTSGRAVQSCANGCSVNPGSDDTCKSGGTSSGGCVVGGYYCGGDKVSGDANTLYQCTGGSSGRVVQRCASGCSVNSGQDDWCKPAGSGNCVVGGYYCGGDKVNGDPNTLYKCTGGSSGTVVERCGSGCSVNAGKDDSCKSGGGCVVGGYYCGGDKVSGDSSTLYKCTGGSSGTVAQRCASGCSVNSGQDDSCKGGGSCVVGGSYCGGDKVSGDPNTLYKCTGGSSGSVIRKCASGCSVNSGRDDTCK